MHQSYGRLFVDRLYNVKRETLANQQNIVSAKKSPTWEIKQKFRPPDASGGRE